ncbi:TPA: histone-like nucleoid-structuring protein, MvaT/MvaU family [Pseudomonas aeruginosa]|uniref:histone-like nucleoid-structuring protein, MvaT/MvaU family n=1 Tax=Pseudomonas aeruginosa TaxID=287 RepID=UPI000F82CF54|nr:histone-like nucleoid-structuring protein, MvaT/MvaU family [Pseudomonas aeruginosa]MBG4156478.1 DNA binding protein [Pseudomonas aeruginosa]MBG4168774.1 DNA binding protein [Pseudomonas aeruginosa]MBG4487284.1 DNA binding protein [Pseudomonas aeruginosa]MBG4499699.1 DNA binding protein [Pseudomonas aeruginosa]RTR70083.1 transcriptional regulator [Pseudomonas aeruginosa]
MSKIALYKALEAQIAEQLAQLDALKNSGDIQRELEFEEKLQSLLQEYGYTLREIIEILDPSRSRALSVTTSSTGRKPRALRRYKNPNTGEVIETKGGNHKVLKIWKAEHGNATVEGWLQ